MEIYTIWFWNISKERLAKLVWCAQTDYIKKIIFKTVYVDKWYEINHILAKVQTEKS